MAGESDLASWEAGGRAPNRQRRREATHPPRRRRWLIVGGAVLLALVLLVAFAPMIVAAAAPGRVADSLSQDIEGDVRIDSMSLNWFGSTHLRDVTLLDPDGGEVATLTIKAPVSVWRALTEGWWSRRHLELGRIEVTGNAVIVREADGSTNLMRAVAPTGPQEPSKRDAFEGVLALDGVDVVVAARGPDGKLDQTTRSELRDVTGEVAFDYDKRRGTQLTAKGDLETALAGEAAAAGQRMKVAVDVDGNVSAAGSLSRSKGVVRATTVPVAVLDVLGGFNGALGEAVGLAATVQAEFSGDLRAGEAKITLESQGAGADIRAQLIDGALRVQDGAEVRLASTAGLGRLPALADAVARARQRVQISEAPGATVTIRSTNIPIAAVIEKGVSPGELDLRGASVDLSVAIDEMQGEVLLVEAEGEEAQGAEPTAGEMRVFALEPVVVNVSSLDLSQGLTINASTAARVGSNSAGSAQVDLTAVGLLTEQGRLAALVEGAAPVSGLNGAVSLTDLSAALVQPIVDALGQPIDVAQDIGQAISLSLQASTSGDVTADEIPPTRLELVAGAEHATIGGTLVIEDGVLRTVRESSEGAGLTAQLAAAGPLARRLAGEAVASRLQGQMPVEVQVTELVLPLAGEARLQQLVANVTAFVTDAGLGLASPEQEGGAAPVRLRQMRLTGSVAPESPARFDLEASMSQAESAFLVRGQVELTGARGAAAVQEALAVQGPGTIERLRPSGQIMAKGVPGSIFEAIGLRPDETEGAAREVMLALSEALGRSADVSVTFEPGAEDRAPTILARASGAQAGADVALATREGAVAVREATARMTVSAGRATSLLAALTAGDAPEAAAAQEEAREQPAPEQGGPIAVVGADVPLVLTVQPVTVPMEGWRPRAGSDAAAVAAVSIDGPVRLEQIEGRVQEITLVIADAQAQVTAPIASLLPAAGEGEAAAAGDQRKPMQATLSAGLQDGQGESIASINGEATIAPDRTLRQARAVVDEIDTFRIDDMLGVEGAVSGLLGDTATIRAALTPQSATLRTIDMEVLAPNVSGAALTLEATEQQVSLTKPAKITWIVQPAAANHFLGIGGSEAGALVEALTARVNVDQLAFAVPSEVEGRLRGPLAPDVFALGATVQFEQLRMRATPTELATLNGIRASVGSAQQPGALSFSMEVAGVTGDQGAQEGESAIRGSVSNLADANGVLTPQLAQIDAQGALSHFPTALADAIARQNGVLLAALGPAVSLRVDAVGLTREQGQLSAALRSQRADANVAGRVETGRFVTTAPLQVRFTEIHPELVSALAGSLPVVSTLEKTPSHEPGMVRTEGLIIPINGDVSKLNGTVTVDLGEVNFATRPVFGEFIKALGGQQQGTIGRSIEPFTVRITDGVLEYDKYSLPIGEFSIQTRGRVDLVNRTMNVVTYVPLFALSDEAAGMFNTSLAGRVPMLDKATLVPLRTSGAIGSTNTQLDMELFVRERGQDLRDLPGNVIDELGNIINTGRRDRNNGNGDK